MARKPAPDPAVASAAKGLGSGQSADRPGHVVGDAPLAKEDMVQMRRKNATDAPVQVRLRQPDRAQAAPDTATSPGPAAADPDQARTEAVPAGVRRDDRGADERQPDYRAGTWQIDRSKGLLTGLLLVLLGIWGAIVPFVGPYFGYGLGNTGAWYFTVGRLWLDVLPGIAVLLGGAVLAASRNRAVAWLAAWLALAGGIWFAVGAQISRLWTADGINAAGAVTGAIGHQVAQYMGYFTGLGAVVCVLAALAAGRLTVRGARDVRAA